MACLRVSVVPVGEGCSEQGRDGSVGVLLLYCCSHWSPLCRGSWWVMDSSVVATWAGVVVAIIAAIASAILTGVTIWWPWHTRGRVAWFPVEETDTNLCPNPRLSGLKGFFVDVNGVTIWPQGIIRMYNSGDAAAYGITVEPDDAIVIEVGHDGEQGTRAASNCVPHLAPGDFFFIALITAPADRDSFVLLHWSESPTNAGHTYVQEIPASGSGVGLSRRPKRMRRAAADEWRRNRPNPHRRPVDTDRPA